MLELNPNDARAYNNIAWIRATHPDPRFRNAVEAVALATRAVELARDDVNSLDTLAAAYAEAGRFSEAVQTAARPWIWPPNKTSSRWQNPSRPRFRFTKRALPFARCNQHRRPVQPGLDDE